MATRSALTWSPASVGGKSAAESGLANRPERPSTAGPSMWASTSTTRATTIYQKLLGGSSSNRLSSPTRRPRGNRPARAPRQVMELLARLQEQTAVGIFGGHRFPRARPRSAPENRLLPWTCVEIKISRRVRAASSRRPPRHRRDAWLISTQPCTLKKFKSVWKPSQHGPKSHLMGLPFQGRLVLC